MTSTMAYTLGSHAEVSVSVAAELCAAGALVLDVREDSEWAVGHAPQAMHIPLTTLRNTQRDLVPKGRTVLVLCRSGFRSGNAATLLADRGYDAVNVAGGMLAWSQAGLPVLAHEGVSGTVE